jgi:hypothetical protein
MCAKYLCQNGVEIWEDERGFFNAARLCGEEEWFHFGHPEFLALVARFHGQGYFASAW